MTMNDKDVPNGELVPEKSELQLADIRIQDLERQLKAAEEEISKLKEQLAAVQAPQG